MAAFEHHVQPRLPEAQTELGDREVYGIFQRIALNSGPGYSRATMAPCLRQVSSRQFSCKL